jgi:histidinol dehydrogenase
VVRLLNAATHRQAILDLLDNREQMEDEAARESVRCIVNDVRMRKDEALFEYTKQFDGVQLCAETIRIPKEEVDAIAARADREMRASLQRAADNIRRFHEKQLQTGFLDREEGKALGQLIRPIESVGVYAPGGTAAYPSSVLMNVLPAKVAGVRRIALATPPNLGISPNVMAAASIAGVDTVYRMGGAQAIAALAFGTQSVRRVDKITGPGNRYVALAKREVYGFVGIDMIAGPSEVLVVADESADASYVAADMLSQAEHDVLSACILITTDIDLAHRVREEIKRQLKALKRQEIARSALENYGLIVVAKDLHEAMELANAAAPEHLELAVKEPFLWLKHVKNAGAVFLGHYAPETLGDYYAGTNHVLPTSGTARFFSPLGVYDFIKRTSVVYYDQTRLQEASEDIERLALGEGLDAHAAAVAIRRKDGMR